MPRGRPRKPRLSRMDAAVDAMSLYGFPEEIIKKTVKELLKEYGGDEGWPFIEDCSYKELLEAILREQEKDNLEQAARDGDQIKDKSSGEEEPETSTRAADTQQEPQDNASTEIVAVAEHVCPDTEIVVVAKPICFETVPSISVIDNAEADGNGWKDILPDQTIEETANHVTENDKDPPTKVHSPRISEIPSLPSPDSVPALPPPPPPPKSRRRLPRYGWIDSDEDEVDDDFITLEPGPWVFRAKAVVPGELSESPRGARRMRKSRWDERPDDH